MRKLLCCVCVLVVSAAAPAAAQAAITSVLQGETWSGAAIPCPAQSDGVRVCHGFDTSTGATDLRLKTFDGIPQEIYVILPPAPTSGTDGNYPLIVQSHGYAGQAGGPSDTQFYGPTADTLAKEGFAVLQLTARGFGDSCGTVSTPLDSQTVDPTATAACTSQGFIRLDDDRYEVRDIQYAIGLLVDEGIVDPHHIGVTGESYGGGVSLQLATLKDRIMNADGTTSPWTSPKGVPLSIAAAAPVIPWSDLVYSLVPNGRDLDTQVVSPTQDLSPAGVEKESYVSGLYADGNTNGYYAPSGADPQWDLTNWFAQIEKGEPYDGNSEIQYIETQIAQFHSAYYLLDGAYGVTPEEPPPLLIANGFDDDLFPVDEALRYYNLEQSKYPGDPIQLFDGDFGHARAQNKKDVESALSSAINTFFNYYLKASGSQPPSGFTAYTETCPSTTPSGGPYTAATWAGLHPGSVTYSTTQTQTISSTAGDPTIGTTLDPILGKGACATVPATDQGSGVATYRLPAATGSGYTLLGSATVLANIQVSGQYPEIAERLWDVDPSTNTETLVSRGVFRPDPTSPSGLVSFQLHPGGWHFAAGHIPKLELLGSDVPYARASNGAFSITITGLSLSLPTAEPNPGSGSGSGGGGSGGSGGGGSGTTGGCHVRPTSTIAKKHVHASRHGLTLHGSASEKACAHAGSTAGSSPHVAHVFVIVIRPRPHGQCEFLTRRGTLTKPRRCSSPVRFRASGTRNWSARLKVRIPPGPLLVRSDAVDTNHRHQRHSKLSAVWIHVH